MLFSSLRIPFTFLLISILLASCAPASVPSAELQVPTVVAINGNSSPDFAAAND
ncbi:MAG TPA: hypothetical protein VFQ23_12165 [Anaerolineales bacterium]|nr:hypothetical protein [Anaerolineales bacterium]